MSKTLKKANPNRHGWVRLIEETADDGSTYYLVRQPDNEEYGSDPDDFEDLDKATQFFDELVKELNETPNWKAQAEYDERNGTDNGYSPWQYNREY